MLDILIQIAEVTLMVCVFPLWLAFPYMFGADYQFIMQFAASLPAHFLTPDNFEGVVTSLVATVAIVIVAAITWIFWWVFLLAVYVAQMIKVLDAIGYYGESWVFVVVISLLGSTVGTALANKLTARIDAHFGIPYGGGISLYSGVWRIASAAYVGVRLAEVGAKAVKKKI
jgi:hypothetical protein